MADSSSQPKPQSEPLIRNVSDTARWVAVYRAQETERPDAIFRDPFARRLAGERGEQIAQLKPLGGDSGWSMNTRTYLIDEFVKAELQRGTDLVINLAAGLDARPYRMQLPPSLRWVEVDLPEILDYKESILRNDKPVCVLERIRLDLSDVSGRRALFARLARSATRALVITEGLMIYLTPEVVGELASDLSAPPSFHSWIVDIASPGLVRMLQKRMASELWKAAPFKFAPEEGPAFFERFGWKTVEVQSYLKNAAKLKRLSLLLRLFALLPETEKSRRDRPWSGACLFTNTKSL
jgi:methyltransferase (TIGR00027 family)